MSAEHHHHKNVSEKKNNKEKAGKAIQMIGLIALASGAVVNNLLRFKTLGISALVSGTIIRWYGKWDREHPNRPRSKQYKKRHPEGGGQGHGH